MSPVRPKRASAARLIAGLLAAWVVFWLVLYAGRELRLQFLVATRFSAPIEFERFAFPWAVVYGAALTGLFALVFAQIGGWIAGALRLSAIAEPGAPTRRLHDLEEWAVSFTLGAIAAGTITLLLGLLGGGFPWTAIGALAALSWPVWIVGPLALVMAARAALAGRLGGTFLRRPPMPSSTTTRWLVGATAALLAFSLLYALTPPIQSDGLRYHLAAPQEYLKAGRVLYLPYSAFTNFPFLVEMLFTLAMALGSDLAAKGAHWLCLAAGALWVYLLVAQICFWDRPDESRAHVRQAPAALAALMFVATPAVLIVGAWEFIDLGVTAFFLAFVFALARWTQTRRRGWLAAVGLFGGGCLGAKYTTVPIVALGGLWIVAMSLLPTRCDPRKPPLVAARRFVVAMGLAAAVAAPWYLKNLAWTGNPVYPLAWGLFDGGEWSEANAEFYMSKAAGKGFAQRIKRRPVAIPWAAIQTPMATAFRWRPNPRARWGGFEDHNIGVGYLLALPIVLAWMARALWRWRADPVRAVIALFTAEYAAQWFFTYQSNRFLIPLLALACVATADGARALSEFFGLTKTEGEESRSLSAKATQETQALQTPRITEGASDQISTDANGPSSALSPPGSLSAKATYLAPWLAPARWVWAAVLVASALNAAWAIRWIGFDAGHPSPLSYTLGLRSREAYLADALPHYRFVANLDDLIEDDAAVLFVGEHRGYYCDARYLTSDWFDTPRVLAFIRASTDNDAMLDALIANGVRYIFFNGDELGKYIGAPQLFRDRFTAAEWRRFVDLLDSPRLRRVVTQDDIWLARIVPSATTP